MDLSSTIDTPKNLRIDAIGEESVTLAWDRVDGATSYEIRYDEDKGTGEDPYGIFPAWLYYEWCTLSVGNQTSFTTSGTRDCENQELEYGRMLSASTSYHWSVRSKNEETVSAWATSSNFVTLEKGEFRDYTSSDVTLYDPNRFNITLIFLDDFHPVMEEVIKEGAEAWERIITADLPDEKVTYKGQEYDVDDVILFVRNHFSHTYDGNLSTGGSILQRDEEALKRTTIVGIINIDTHLEELLRRSGHEWSKGWLQKARSKVLNQARFVVIHEIAHALGLARLGSVFGEDGKCYWDGPAANALFGRKIPLEQGCGHWLDEYFPNGVVSSLSLLRQDFYQEDQVYDFITDIEVAAISDLGYTVDYTYAVPSITH